jgi:predicted transglutaminase-like cysteine proteinase
MPRTDRALPRRRAAVHAWAACAWLVCQPWIQRVLVAGFLFTCFHPLAWDAERMLAAAQKQGPRALAGAKALQAVMHSALDMDDAGKLDALNQFFNRRIMSREDIDVWGQVDYWASPMEMMDKGAGDCEDFAIAKYFSLVALGMPIQKLRLVYVRAQIGGPGGAVQAHMVLAYYSAPNAEPLILDSLITDVRPASRRPDLAPVFSFNSEGLWQGVGSQAAGDPAARLSRWREILVKARAEGFQ